MIRLHHEDKGKWLKGALGELQSTMAQVEEIEANLGKSGKVSTLMQEFTFQQDVNSKLEMDRYGVFY